MISQTVEDVHQVPVRPLVPSEWILRSSFISSSYSYSLRPLASLSQHRTARSDFIAVSIRELTHCFIVKICRSISVVSHQLLSRKTGKYVHGKFHPLWLFEVNKNFSFGIWSHFVQRCGDNVVGFTCRAAKGFIFENTVTWTWTGAVIRNCNWCLVTRSEVTLLWSVMSFHPEKQTWSHCCGDFFLCVWFDVRLAHNYNLSPHSFSGTALSVISVSCSQLEECWALCFIVLNHMLEEPVAMLCLH